MAIDYRIPELSNYNFQQSVKSVQRLYPPGGESKGWRYVVAGNGGVATGDWAGKEKYIAIYNGATWDFLAPIEGMLLWTEDVDAYYHYNGSAWKVGTGYQIANNALYLGDGNGSNNKQIIALMGDTYEPNIRYAADVNKWQYSNDGVTWNDMAAMGTRATFNNGDLSSGILTVVHGLGLSAPYSIEITVFDNNNQKVIPDNITGLTNSVQIDLSSFITAGGGHIDGTWGYVYGAAGAAGPTGPTGPAGFADDGTVNPTNLLFNGNFENWSAGTAVAPDAWTLEGSGATIAQEASIIKLGTYSCKLTRVGNDCDIYQTVHTEKGINYWKGRTITLNCLVYATVANRAFIRLYDGTIYDSDYHPGDSQWHLLTVSMTVKSDATYIYCYLNLSNGNTSVYFDGAICTEGESIFAFAGKPAVEGTWADYSAVSTIVGWTAAGRTAQIYVKKIGKTVFVEFYITGTSNSTSTNFTVPYNASGSLYMRYLCITQDNTGAQTVGWGYTNLSSNVITVLPSLTVTNWTASGTKTIMGQLFFEEA